MQTSFHFFHLMFDVTRGDSLKEIVNQKSNFLGISHSTLEDERNVWVKLLKRDDSQFFICSKEVDDK